MRSLRGFSQEVFAELAGLDRSYLGKVERAETNISINNIEKIAEALGAPPASLMTDEM